MGENTMFIETWHISNAGGYMAHDGLNLAYNFFVTLLLDDAVILSPLKLENIM